MQGPHWPGARDLVHREQTIAPINPASPPAKPQPLPTTFPLTSPTNYVHVMFVTDAATLSAPERCVLMIEALIEVIVGGLNSGLSGKMIIQVWRRLTVIAMRLSLANAWPIRSRGIGAPALPRERWQPAPRPEPQYKPFRLPTGHAWLLRLVPDAQEYAHQLQSMLMEPEMAALLQARPGLDRLLRPLCRMLGVKPPSTPTRYPTANPPQATTPARPEPTPPPGSWGQSAPVQPEPAPRPAITQAGIRPERA